MVEAGSILPGRRLGGLRPSFMHAPLLDGWRPVSRGEVQARPANEETPSFYTLFQEEPDSPLYKEILAFTGFGLDEFKLRTERDSAKLVILASHRMHRFGGASRARMRELAEEHGIPVIDQGDFIHRQGAELRDAAWVHDDWSVAGHRFAAGALLEYLLRNNGICRQRRREAAFPDDLVPVGFSRPARRPRSQHPSPKIFRTPKLRLLAPAAAWVRLCLQCSTPNTGES